MELAPALQAAGGFILFPKHPEDRTRLAATEGRVIQDLVSLPPFADRAAELERRQGGDQEDPDHGRAEA